MPASSTKCTVLAACLFLAVMSGCRRQGVEDQIHATAHRGEYILRNIVNRAAVPPGWPQYGHIESSNSFRTSTSYFMKSLDLHPAYFAAPGLPKCTKAEDFSAANNAWCLVADARGVSPSTPVLFTRNLALNSLDNLRGTVRDNLSDRPPFGKTGLVYITRDGRSHVLQEDDLYKEMKRVFPVAADGNRRVLRP